MKTPESVLVLALAFFFPVVGVQADLLLEQNFDAPPTVAALIDTTSSDTSRFHDISVVPGDADDLPAVPPGIVEEQRLAGVASVAIDGGKLRYSLLSAYQTYYNEGSAPSTRQRNQNASTGQIVRLFPPGSRPDRLFWRFKLSSDTADLPSSDAFLQRGEVRIQAGKILASGAVDGGSRLRFTPQSGPDVIVSGEIIVTVAINKTAGALTYPSPLAGSTSVGAARYDLWVNGTQIVDEGEFLAGTQIESAQVRFTAGVANQVQDLGGGSFGIPLSPGPPFVFFIDDVLMRSDFTGVPAAGAPAISLSGNLNFGRKRIRSATRKTFSIRNTGSSALAVSSVRYPNPVYSGRFSGTIAAGAARKVSVLFGPRAARSYNGTLRVVSDAASGRATLPMKGSGLKSRKR